MAQFNFGEIVFLAVKPVFRMLIMVGLGVFAAQQGILTKDSRRSLNQLTFVILMPCLLFVKLAESMTFNSLKTWWPLLANIAFMLVLGYALGWVQVLLLRPPVRMRIHILLLSMFGNVGNLPLVLAASLAEDATDFFGPDASALGEAYVAFPMGIAGLFMFGVGYQMIQRGSQAASAPAPKLERLDTAATARSIHALLVTEGLGNGAGGDFIPVEVYLDQDAGSPVGGAGREIEQATGSGAPAGLQRNEANGGANAAHVELTDVTTAHVENGGAPYGTETVQYERPSGQASVNIAAAWQALQGQGGPTEALGPAASPPPQCTTCAAELAKQMRGRLLLTLPQVAGLARMHSASIERAGLDGVVVAAPPQQPEPVATTGMCGGVGRTARDVYNMITWLDQQLSHVRGYKFVKGNLSPPNVGTLLGIVVGLIPPVKLQVESSGEPLFFAGNAAAIVGAAMLPAMMLALGATLHNGPGAGKVPPRVLAGLVVTRLVLTPLLGAGTVYGLFRAGAFEVPDRMFLLIMLSTHMVPSATNVQVMASVANSCELEVAAMLFWQYILCVFTIPVALFTFLRLVEIIPLEESI